MASIAPLSGIKILDFSRILAAPFASMILSDLGAEVWKIEKPGTGDDTRQWVPPSINGQSCYFISVNRNKKSLAIDLKQAKGRELICNLATKCDVLLENFKVGGMKRLGLDYDSIKKFNPGIIYCSITGYGPTGPSALRGGYDVIAEAEGGFMSITGSANGEPCKAGVAVTDMLTGLFAHGAILAALLQRQQTGRGQKIDCNLLATQIAVLTNLGSNYLNAGWEGRRWGTAHESIFPYQAFKTKDDRYFVIGAGNDKAFGKLCQVMGIGKIAEMEDYRTNAARVKNRERLEKILQDKFSEEDVAYWTEIFGKTSLPNGPVNSLKEAFAHPQVKHLHLVQKITHPVAGPPVIYGESENRIRSAPPLLGEHTKEVLVDILGLNDQQLTELRDQKVIQY